MPAVMFGPSLSLELDWREGAASWGPSVRLTGYYATGEKSGEVGGARVRMYGVRVDGCSFFLRSGRWLEAAPCVDFAMGAIHAEGIIANPDQDTRVWVDAGVSARGRLLAASWLAFEAQAGMVVPLTRYTLEFQEPDRLFYKIPAVGARMLLGVSGQIP